MKLAVVLGLLAVAFASQQWELQSENVNEKAFRAGKHYTFRFEGQISTGLPVPSSSQQSATRVQSIVSVVFENDRQALLKLQRTRFGSGHRDLVEPREVQPFGLFEEIELNSEQKEKLSLPIRFRYEQGLISEIEFEREDQAWSENIKRAVLNMLQLNLGKKSRTDEAEMVRINREPSERSEWPQKDSFSTQEVTIEGDCETTYTVTPNGQEKFRVAKSINYEKCTKRVDIRYNFLGENCPSCEKRYNGEEQVTESSTVVNFELNGNTEEFLIREVELRSQYLFAPLSKEQQPMGTFVSNKLILVKVDGEKDAVRAPKSEKKDQLVYNTEWEEALEKFRMTGDESLLKDSPYMWMVNKIDIARNAISHLRRHISEEEKAEEVFQPEVVRQIARLIEVLRVSTKSEILSIEKEMNKEERLSGLFFDILAQTGTKTSVDVLARKMADREITSAQAVKLFKILMTLRNPSEEIVEILVRLQKEEIVSRNPAVQQSLWLTVGALMHVQCGEHRSRFVQEIAFDKQETICPRRLKEKYVDILERFFEKSEGRYEKVLALKTIANAGFDLIAFPLEKIIRNEREEKTVRLQAIDALRKLRQNMPRKIQSILMPVFKNIREHPEIRVSAFNQIMQTVPERAIIDQITQQLEREPSHQVHSFVYSALRAYAKSELPCEKDMSRDIQTSLKLARSEPRKMYDSAFIRASMYSEQYTTGAAINWAALFSNDSAIPKEVMASLDTVFAGDWNKYLAQIGIAQQNLDQILYKLFEKLEKNDYSLEDVIVRGKRSSSLKPTEVLKQLMKKMGIQQRRFSSDEPHALVYLRYRDNDFVVLPLEEETLKNLAKDVIKGDKIYLGELERVLAKGYRFEAQVATFVYERTRMIATTLGMPLEITGKMPTYFSVEGEIKAEFEPKSGNNFQGVRMHVKAQPKIASTHILHMEVRSPVHSNGIKLLHSINIHTPIDASVELTWEKNFDAKFTVRAPENREQRRVLTLISRPVTYIRFENNKERSMSANEKTHYIGEQPRVEVDRVYGEKIFGLRFNVRGNIHRHMWEKMQQTENRPIIVSENHLDMTMEKTPETPREYVIRFNVAAFESEKMISERPEFEQFYEKETESHFEVEDSDYMNEDEKERRGSFDKYTKEYKKSSGYKHRFHVKAYTVGSSEERKGEMEMKTVCDDEWTFCKWTVEAQRSPILEGERREWTLSAGLQTLFPQPIVSLQQLKEQKHREMVAMLEAKWGAEEKNTLKLRLQGEQSKEQQKWQRLVQRKSEDKKMGESLEKLELASRLNQIKISAEYKIQPETLVQIDRINTLLKAYNPLSSSVEILEPRQSYNKEGRLIAKLTVEPQTWRYLNVSIQTPSERVEIKNIRLPFRPTFLTISKSNSGMAKWNNGLRNFSPACEVTSSRVNTFDEIIYRAPLTTCYSVLAKDCSEEPKFAVLMKKTEKRGEEKKLKIVTQESTIEIENKRGDLIVSVNGKIVEDEEKLQKWGLEKKYDVVIFQSGDIFVRFDGIKAEIKMNDYYKTKQCGLCGHYDGEREGEFRRADDVETEDLEEFHRSFLTRDDEECEMEEDKLSDKKNYKKYERFERSEENSWEQYDSYDSYDEKSLKSKSTFDKFEDDEHKENIEPLEKTRVIEYASRVCFSQEPIPECPRKTFRGEETKEIKAKFSCVERSSPEARRLLRESRNQVLSIAELPVSFVETLVVPKKCVVY